MGALVYKAAAVAKTSEQLRVEGPPLHSCKQNNWK